MRKYHRRYQKIENQKEIAYQSTVCNEWYDYYDIDEIFKDMVKYTYLDDENENDWFYKWGNHPFKKQLLRIDMESFYTKEDLRQRRIDKIFGEIQDLSNTIENILSLKKQL